MSDLFNKLLQETPDHTKRFISRSMDVSDQIVALLKKKGISQRELASKLGKNESEVSRWLCGNHNFTLRTLAKIESIIGEAVLVAPMYWHEYNGSFAPSDDKFIFKVVHEENRISNGYYFPEEETENYDDILNETFDEGKVIKLTPVFESRFNFSHAGKQ